MPDCCVCEQNDSSAHLRSFQYFLITMSCRFNSVLVDQFFMADFSVKKFRTVYVVFEAGSQICSYNTVYVCRFHPTITPSR